MPHFDILRPTSHLTLPSMYPGAARGASEWRAGADGFPSPRPANFLCFHGPQSAATAKVEEFPLTRGYACIQLGDVL
jgi:hypothetical protein